MSPKRAAPPVEASMEERKRVAVELGVSDAAMRMLGSFSTLDGPATPKQKRLLAVLLRQMGRQSTYSVEERAIWYESTVKTKQVLDRLMSDMAGMSVTPVQKQLLADSGVSPNHSAQIESAKVAYELLSVRKRLMDDAARANSPEKE